MLQKFHPGSVGFTNAFVAFNVSTVNYLIPSLPFYCFSGLRLEGFPSLGRILVWKLGTLFGIQNLFLSIIFAFISGQNDLTCPNFSTQLDLWGASRGEKLPKSLLEIPLHTIWNPKFLASKFIFLCTVTRGEKG